jgi:hypothetical protein
MTSQPSGAAKVVLIDTASSPKCCSRGRTTKPGVASAHAHAAGTHVPAGAVTPTPPVRPQRHHPDVAVQSDVVGDRGDEVAHVSPAFSFKNAGDYFGVNPLAHPANPRKHTVWLLDNTAYQPVNEERDESQPCFLALVLEMWKLSPHKPPFWHRRPTTRLVCGAA